MFIRNQQPVNVNQMSKDELRVALHSYDFLLKLNENFFLTKESLKTVFQIIDRLMAVDIVLEDALTAWHVIAVVCSKTTKADEGYLAILAGVAQEVNKEWKDLISSVFEKLLALSDTVTRPRLTSFLSSVTCGANIEAAVSPGEFYNIAQILTKMRERFPREFKSVLTQLFVGSSFDPNLLIYPASRQLYYQCMTDDARETLENLNDANQMIGFLHNFLKYFKEELFAAESLALLSQLLEFGIFRTSAKTDALTVIAKAYQSEQNPEFSDVALKWLSRMFSNIFFDESLSDAAINLLLTTADDVKQRLQAPRPANDRMDDGEEMMVAASSVRRRPTT